MPWTDNTGPVPRRSPEELRSVVDARAEALRERRRQIGAVLSSLVVLVAGITVAIVRAESPTGTEVRSASGQAASSTAVAPTTATLAAGPTTTRALPLPPPTNAAATTTTITRPPSATSPTEPPVPTTTGATSTTTSVVCRNSFDRACGPLVWDPPPGPNAPLTLQVTFTPAAPKIGEEVVFRVVGNDPDSPVAGCATAESYGDNSVGDGCLEAACLPQWGPWTPVRSPGSREITYRHAYMAAGTYVAKFSMSSSTCGASMPYSSYASTEATVTVSP